MKKTFLENLFGPGDPGMFLAALVYAMVGVTISLLYDSSKRDQNKVSTPNDFSWGYLLIDNIKRIVLSVLLVVVSLRFSRELLGADLTMYLALLIGIGFDRLGLLLKNKGVLPGNPEDRFTEPERPAEGKTKLEMGEKDGEVKP